MTFRSRTALKQGQRAMLYFLAFLAGLVVGAGGTLATLYYIFYIKMGQM